MSLCVYVYYVILSGRLTDKDSLGKYVRETNTFFYRFKFFLQKFYYRKLVENIE